MITKECTALPAADGGRFASSLQTRGLADLFSCLGCSSCSSVCPACLEPDSGGFQNASAMPDEGPMDPQKFVRLALMGMDEAVLNTGWIWNCSLCRKCTDACPQGIAVANAIMEARALQQQAAMPRALRQTLERSLFSGNTLGALPAWLLKQVKRAERMLLERFGLDQPIPVDLERAEVLLVPNFPVLDRKPEILAHYARIFHAAGQSWTLSSLGIDAVCPPWFAQDRYGAQRWMDQIAGLSAALGSRICVIDDCANPLAPFGAGRRHQQPEASRGARHSENGRRHMETVSMTQLIFRYLEEGRISLRASRLQGMYTVHDPCSVAHRQEHMEFPRTLLEFFGAEVQELPIMEENSVCCGGSLLSCGLEKEALRFGQWKLHQIVESGADHVLVICTSCLRQLDMLLSSRAAAARVLFLPSLVAENLEGREKRRQGQGQKR